MHTYKNTTLVQARDEDTLDQLGNTRDGKEWKVRGKNKLVIREFGNCGKGVKGHAQVSRSTRLLSFSRVGNIRGGGG